jgi:hypothetical protein
MYNGLPEKSESIQRSDYMPMKKTNPARFYQKEDVSSLRFFKLPKVLFYSLLYRSLSTPAKVLYSILLDRLELSLKNRWVDEQGRVFVVFRGKPAREDARKFEEKTREEVSLTELLDVDPRSIRKYKDELISHHLLIEKRPGQGNSNHLYLLKPEVDSADTYKKETPEQLICSEVHDNLSMYEIHEILLKQYGSTSLEKAFVLTAGNKIPVKGYYAHMKNVLERLSKEAEQREEFLQKQQMSLSKLSP